MEYLGILVSALGVVEAVTEVDVLVRPGGAPPPPPRADRSPALWVGLATLAAAAGLIGVIVLDPAPVAVTALLVVLALGMVACVRSVRQLRRTGRPAPQSAPADISATPYVDPQRLIAAVGDTLLTVDSYLHDLRPAVPAPAGGDLWSSRPRLVGVVQDILAHSDLDDWDGLSATIRRLRQVLKEDAIEPVRFTGQNAALFEFIPDVDEPDRSEPLTRSPALVRDGHLLIRGLVAEPRR